MPTITDIAVCIRRWDFSETSQTVSLFTRDQGILRGIAKGAKREKGNFSGGVDVLTLGQVVAIVKPGRDLATLTHWDLRNMYRAVRRNLRANRAALYMADLVHHMFNEGDAHPVLFDALTETLEQLGEHDRIDGLLLRFQWVMLREAGYQPEVERDAETGQPLTDIPAVVAFSPTAGGIVADRGTGDQWRVRRETLELLRSISNESDVSGVADDVVDRANRLLAVYVRTLIGNEPPTLRWMFPDLKG